MAFGKPAPAAASGAKAVDLIKNKGNALEKARAYALSKRKEEFEQIRVKLDMDGLKVSLPHVSTGSLVVDYIIGGMPNSFGVAPCPGFPRGRCSQIWGAEASGKTTLALMAAAAVNKEGGSVLYIDWENDIVPDYAHHLGVAITDDKRFELLQPDHLEDGIKYALIYAAAGVDLIVFDSVGAALPRRLADRDLADSAEQGKIGELQAVWSQELPNIKRIIARSGTAVLGISQTRVDMGSQHGGMKPQGGNAWKFYSSVRLELKKIDSEKTRELNPLTHQTEEKVSGNVVKCKAVKCKMSRSQGREEIFYIRQGHGVDNIRSILEIAMAHGIVKKGGAGWFSWTKPDGSVIKLQGLDKLRQHLAVTTSDFDILDSLVRPLLGSGKSAAQFVDAADSIVIGEDEGIVEDDASETVLSADESEDASLIDNNFKRLDLTAKSVEA